MPNSLPSINSKPSNLPNTETSTKQTEESIKDQNLSFDTDSQEDNDFLMNKQFLQENITLKLQLLARTGMSTTRISLISNTASRPSSAMLSYQQSISSQVEEIKSNGSLLQRLLFSPTVKDSSYMDIFWRSDSEIREKFIQRLKSRKILDAEGKRKHQSLVIIDWDGALFCGSDLEELKENVSLGKSYSLLKALDEEASNLLLRTTHYCETFIITNYSESLVEYRARLFLPKTYSIIVAKHIQIVSTRHYESNDIRDNFLQKVGLFSIKERFQQDLVANMICIVNSQTKIDMMSFFAKHFQGSILKIVKFKEYPNVSELLKQQNLLLKDFDTMFFSTRNFIVKFSKKICKK